MRLKLLYSMILFKVVETRSESSYGRVKRSAMIGVLEKVKSDILSSNIEFEFM